MFFLKIVISLYNVYALLVELNQKFCAPCGWGVLPTEGQEWQPPSDPCVHRKSRLNGSERLGSLQLLTPAGGMVLIPCVIFFYLDVNNMWNRGHISC